jgi:hypothetical protein
MRPFVLLVAVFLFAASAVVVTGAAYAGDPCARKVQSC